MQNVTMYVDIGLCCRDSDSLLLHGYFAGFVARSLNNYILSLIPHHFCGKDWPAIKFTPLIFRHHPSLSPSSGQLCMYSGSSNDSWYSRTAAASTRKCVIMCQKMIPFLAILCGRPVAMPAMPGNRNSILIRKPCMLSIFHAVKIIMAQPTAEGRENKARREDSRNSGHYRSYLDEEQQRRRSEEENKNVLLLRL